MIGKETLEKLDLYTMEYQTDTPFPHIVIDNFLDVGVCHELQKESYYISSNVSEQWRFVKTYDGVYDEHDNQILKRQIHDPSQMLPVMKSAMLYFNSKEFINILEKITGFKNLIGDPNYIGGGYHQTANGGKLGIHHDFNNQFINGKKVYRQVNLLLYLNPSWNVSWGGELELWNRDMSGCAKKVLPKSNRVVIFSIDGAPHGHPEPLKCPADIHRKSMAFYYYNEEEPKFPLINRAHWKQELENMV